MVKEIVRAREFTLAQLGPSGIFGRLAAGPRQGVDGERKIFSLVECPICWALTMPDRAEAHAEAHYE